MEGLLKLDFTWMDGWVALGVFGCLSTVCSVRERSDRRVQSRIATCCAAILIQCNANICGSMNAFCLLLYVGMQDMELSSLNHRCIVLKSGAKHKASD